MARFFFNMMSGDEPRFDDEGIELDDASGDRVRAQIIAFAVSHMIKNHVANGVQLSMEVLDERGTIVASLGVLAD